jgi:tRNA G37 N-methylase TrmD
MAIIEFIRFGEYVKVSAVDEETGIEAVSILPGTLSKMEMQEAALRKLQYVMKKKKSPEDNSGGFTV